MDSLTASPTDTTDYLNPDFNNKNETKEHFNYLTEKIQTVKHHNRILTKRLSSFHSEIITSRSREKELVRIIRLLEANEKKRSVSPPLSDIKESSSQPKQPPKSPRKESTTTKAKVTYAPLETSTTP